MIKDRAVSFGPSLPTLKGGAAFVVAASRLQSASSLNPCQASQIGDNRRSLLAASAKKIILFIMIGSVEHHVDHVPGGFLTSFMCHLP